MNIRKHANPGRLLVRLTALSWLAYGATAPAGECVVKEFFAETTLTASVSVLPPIRTVAVKGPPPLMLMARMSAGEPEDAAQLKNREIWAAINARDIDALTRALPSNVDARRELLVRSFAIGMAFRAGALLLVRQILKWDPLAMSNMTAISKSQNLQGLVGSWQSIDRSVRDGKPVPNPPSGQDEVQLVRMLLDAGADPDGRDYRITPLGVIASMPESPETALAARLLLERGASLEKRNPDGRSALAMASEKKNSEQVRIMLEGGRPSQDALDEAIVYSPIEQSNGAIALLLEHGANINADRSRFGVGGFPPAWTAAVRVKYEGERELMRLLIRYRVDPNIGVNNTNSALMDVMHDHELMKGLLDLGANPNYRNYQGDAPLDLAIRIPQVVRKAPDDNRPLTVIEPALDPSVRRKSVSLLLQYGADPNGANAAGKTPIMLTSPVDAEVVDLLLARGGKIDLNDQALAYYRQYKAPVGPVSWAILHRHDHLAATLVPRDGAIASEDCGAVYYAAQTGATETLSALLDRKADVYAASGLGDMTPLIVAASYGQAAAIKILLDRRAADVNEATPRGVELAVGHGGAMPVLAGGQTALMIGALRGHKDVVAELIGHGANVKLVDASGQSALNYARRAGTNADEIVALLKAGGARE